MFFVTKWNLSGNARIKRIPAVVTVAIVRMTQRKDAHVLDIPPSLLLRLKMADPKFGGDRTKMPHMDFIVEAATVPFFLSEVCLAVAGMDGVTDEVRAHCLLLTETVKALPLKK